MKIDLSFTEENYLKAIYHIGETDGADVSTNSLSESMNTKPATVSDMVKRLSKKKVVKYEKYKGVQLTDTGRKIALQIIRKHRLWEVFLVDKLKFNWDEVHDIAEQLEHIKSPLLVQRLDDFLDNPKIDPHGDPIPDDNGDFNVGPTLEMDKLEAGDQCVFVGVSDSDPRLLQYLDKIKIHLGLKFKILDKVEFDNSMEVSSEKHESIFLSQQVTSQLSVRKL
jgi:DtxR family Mn-dependent transcriptional regulator